MAESRNTPKKATTSKKPAAKKTAVKKVAAKKTVAKKPAAVKAPAKKAPVKKVAPKKQAPRAKKVSSDDDDMASLMAMLNKSGKSNSTKTSSARPSSTRPSNSRSTVRTSSSTPALKLPFMKEDTDKVSYGLTVLAVLMCVATLLTVFVFNGGESRADACTSSKKDLRALIQQYGTAPDEVALKNAATMNAKASANCTNDDYQLFYTNEYSAWMQSFTTINTTPITTAPTNVAPTTAMGMGTGTPEGSSEDQPQG